MFIRCSDTNDTADAASLPHAFEVWLTWIHERGSNWLYILSSCLQIKKKMGTRILKLIFLLDFRISKEKCI